MTNIAIIGSIIAISAVIIFGIIAIFGMSKKSENCCKCLDISDQVLYQGDFAGRNV